MSESHCRSVDIENPCYGKFLPAGVKPEDDKHKKKTSVKNKSSLVDAEDFQRISGKLMPEFNDVKNTRPDDSADNGNDPDVENLIRRHARVSALALKHDQRGQKPQGDENSIPVNAQSADLKSDAVHDSASILLNFR